MCNNNNIVLSLIIPVYNVEQYLEECLNSIFVYQKINHEIEVIIVNDGSTDSSLSILRKYKRKYDFMLIDQKNNGLSEARNVGINSARGKYLIFIDSDDYLIPDILEKLLVYLSDADIDLLEYDYVTFNQKDQKFSINNKMPQLRSGHGDDIFAEWEKSGFYRPMVWTKAVSREMMILNKLYFYPGIYHEDEEWSPKLFAYARKVLFLPLEVYVYRLREGSITSARTRKHYLDLLKVIDLLYDFSCRKDLSAHYIDSLRRYLSFLYFSVLRGVGFISRYDDELVCKLYKNTKLLSFSEKKRRKYLYKWIIDKFGIKKFYMLKYGIKDFFINNKYLNMMF